MAKHKPRQAWAVVHARTGQFVIVDARLPLFWLRQPATAFAESHGFTVRGDKVTARLIRVTPQVS